MANHSSATAREPHVNRTTRTNTIINALKQRAQAVLNDRSIDAQSRAIIRYALETNDPWLAELVRRADAREPVDDTLDFAETPETGEADSNEEKIEALAEMICRAGDEPDSVLTGFTRFNQDLQVNRANLWRLTLRAEVLAMRVLYPDYTDY